MMRPRPPVAASDDPSRGNKLKAGGGGLAFGKLRKKYRKWGKIWRKIGENGENNSFVIILLCLGQKMTELRPSGMPFAGNSPN